MATDVQVQRRRLARPRWASLAHPVYAHELNRWQRARRWRLIRVGCAPLVLVFFAGMGCILSLLIASSGMPTAREQLLSWLGTMMWSLLIGQAIISLGIGLLSTAMTSTVISSEIESETYSLLRVTDVPPKEIAYAKYAATLKQLRFPISIIVGTRLLLIIAAVPAIDLSIRNSGTTGGLREVIGEIPSDTIGPINGSLIVLIGLAWLAFFVLQPILAIAMHASVGLFASSISRTRNNSIIIAAGLRVAVFVVRQIIVSVAVISFNIFISAGTVPFPVERLALAQPSLLVLLAGLVVLVPLLWGVGWRALLTYFMVTRASRRAARLPYE